MFKITLSGRLTTLHRFCSKIGCADGQQPTAGLVQAANGDLYGTTSIGGVNCIGGGPVSGCGTIFRITPAGYLTTLYNFCSQSACADGEYPEAALTQATDGDLYGTTSSGGMDGGTIFKVAPGGTITTLYSFCSQPACADGESPLAGLAQDTNGNMYGTTSAGGMFNEGTVFTVSVGLGPYVETQPTTGIALERIKIFGTNLTGATSVTFNGIAAAFVVISANEMWATVPTGATTGQVQVVTPGRILSSNVPFRVF